MTTILFELTDKVFGRLFLDKHGHFHDSSHIPHSDTAVLFTRKGLIIGLVENSELVSYQRFLKAIAKVKQVLLEATGPLVS